MLNEWIYTAQNKLKGFKEKPQDIPSHPDTYKDEWKGMGDWLGTGSIAPGLETFQRSSCLCTKT